MLTYEWPLGITNYSKSSSLSLNNLGSQALSDLIPTVNPRYIFSIGENCYFEREPFKNQNEICCRFISLSNYSDKEKWFYLLDLNLADSSGSSTTANSITPNPATDMAFERHKTDISKCWFCLANPAATKHLVTYIGKHCYIALAKGPISDDNLIFIPIEHFRGDRSIPIEISNEISHYKKEISSYFSKTDRVAIFYHLCLFQTHWHYQCISIPAVDLDHTIKRLEKFFKDIGFPLSINDPVSERFLEIYAGDLRLSYSIRPNEFFPISSIRQAFVEITGQASDVGDWRTSKYSSTDEISMAHQWKTILSVILANKSER